MEINEDILQPRGGNSGINLLKDDAEFPDHGNEIKEIISFRPPFIVRWGTLLFFILFLVVAIITWIIRYPDLVVVNGVLHSINPPKEVPASSDGKLVKLFTFENQAVKKGTVLGYMESAADHQQVIQLSNLVDSAAMFIDRNETERVFEHSYTGFNNLDELQNFFRQYIQALSGLSNFLTKNS